MIPDETKKQILESALIYDVANEFCELHKSGASFYCTCPQCGKTGKGKGLIVTPGKNIAKCFSCGWSPNPVNFLMEAEKMNYADALHWLADRYNIHFNGSRKRGPQSKGASKKTYCDKQLHASGLTVKDITHSVYVDENTEKLTRIFQPGTRDDYGKIIENGDDMLIWYYDLEGKPVMYQKPKSTKQEHLCRVRWQNPALHTDKNGVPMKYSSPYGSGSHLYIPGAIRRMYKERRQFKRLYIQEGEKKAEKACKHGMPSVGIMGINNIGQNGKLPYELQLLVQDCGIEEVMFILDSDWDHLSTHLTINKSVDQRPRSFFYAIKAYKEYFRTFENLNIYLEIYFATLKSDKEKGIDDLLAGSLKGKELDLRDHIDYAVNAKGEENEFIDVHKITSMSDGQLLEIWSLNNAQAFAEKYSDQLHELREFRIGKHKWKFGDNEKLELAQPLQDDEQFWDCQEQMTMSGMPKVNYRFRYLYAYNFFKRRGYGRIMMASGEYKFCHIEHKIVRLVEPFEIKDYAMELAKEIAPKYERVDIMDMLYRGGKMYFGPDSLSNIDFVQPNFEMSGKDYQTLFFKDKYWKINANGIEEKSLSELEHFVWKDKINDFDASIVKDKFFDIIQVKKEHVGGEFTSGEEITDEHVGMYLIDNFYKSFEDCHFARFVYNTGEFFWEKMYDVYEGPEGIVRRKKADERSLDERLETQMHFISKVTAMGYLLHQFFNESQAKAVIGMDGKLSEVGSSNGGTGKSIFGDAIGKVIPQVSIGGKNKKLTEDPFWAEEVTEKTANVFLDDVRANIDFEFFFPYITGKFMVNGKGDKKFTIDKKQTPKLYFSTNHAILGEGNSFERRQFFIAFSDFYNRHHFPVYDFGANFFDEWDNRQWNLFFNFMAQCIRCYFRYGLVEAPRERLEMRRMRQQIGEEFLQWADEYFSFDESQGGFVYNDKIDLDIPRKELYQDFLDNHPTQKRYVTPTRFKKKFKTYCTYRGAVYNPHNFFDKEETVCGADNKSNGVEYFTLHAIIIPSGGKI